VLSILSSKRLQTVGGLPFRTGSACVALFAAAFWLYTTLWPNAPLIASDSQGYMRVARDLTDFHVDQLHNRAPGFPLLLLITGSSQVPTRMLFFLSLVFHFVAVWLLAAVLHAAGLKGNVLIFFVLLLLLPPYVEPAAYVLTETLTEFMLSAGFVGLVFWFLRRSTIWLVLSALAIAYSALSRPTYQALALAMTGCLFLIPFLLRSVRIRYRDVAKASTALICVSIVLVGGCSFVNYVKFDYFGITPMLGFNLSTKTVRVIERLPDEHAPVREFLIRVRDTALVQDSTHTGVMYIWMDNVIPELTEITGLQKAQLSNYMLKINLLLIAKAPLEYLADVFRVLLLYWFPSTTQLANMSSRYVQLLWAVIHFGLIGVFFLQLVMLVGAVVYIMMSGQLITRKDKVLSSELSSITPQIYIYSLAGTIVLYSMLISCLVEVGNPRYRVPSDALIAFMCFLGVHLWWRLVKLSR